VHLAKCHEKALERRSKGLLVSLALRRRQGEVKIKGTLLEGATPRCDAQIGARLMRVFDIDVGDATANTATRSEEYSQAAN
jgi:hypothetical protein